MKSVLITIVFSVFLLILSITHSLAQELIPQWYIKIGGKLSDHAVKVISQDSNYIYFAGAIEDSASVWTNEGYSSISFSSNGHEDITLEVLFQIRHLSKKIMDKLL